MRAFFVFSALLLAGTTACFADSFTGKLVDADCVTRQGGSTEPSPQAPAEPRNCAPSRSTISFAVQTGDGRMLRFDSTGNARAAEMMSGPSAKMPSTVTVTGVRDGKIIRVESLEIQ